MTDAGINSASPASLAGCRVLVTRAREQAGALSALIRARGGEVVEFAALRIAPPPDWTPLDRALSEAARYDWAVFTSANGVRAFLERMRERGRHVSDWHGVTVAAIGPVTAAALRAAGLPVDVVPDEYRAEALLEAMAATGRVEGKRVALIRALEAREVLPVGLRKLGAEVDVIPAYQTVGDASEAGDVEAMLRAGDIHVLTFASPSAVRHLTSAVPGAPRLARSVGAIVACIGPVTAAEAERAGYAVDVVAREYTAAGLVEAVADAWVRLRRGGNTERTDRGSAGKEVDTVVDKQGGSMVPTDTKTGGTVTGTADSLRYRPRRLRTSASIRNLVRETFLRPEDLIYPLFVIPGRGTAEPVPSLPGVNRLSVDLAVEEARRAREDGIQSVLLFGLPETKDASGSSAWDPRGPVQEAVRAIKKALPDMWVITDVCLCQYTDHGHCGRVNGDRIDNDATLPLLARTALSHAEAGVDMVAPSDMMDGRVAAIRAELDRAGYTDTGIMAYSAKFASAFYGPFREAADSAPQFGDRRSYQMDPANRREALREVELDVAEGADVVMVKPALAYLDVVAAVRDAVRVPVAVYNVSGEYAMIKAAARAGWLDESAAVHEMLLAMKRAGADLIITYFARDAARALDG